MWRLGAGKCLSTDNSELAVLVAEGNEGAFLAQVRVAWQMKNNRKPLERMPRLIIHCFDPQGCSKKKQIQKKEAPSWWFHPHSTWFLPPLTWMLETPLRVSPCETAGFHALPPTVSWKFSTQIPYRHLQVNMPKEKLILSSSTLLLFFHILRAGFMGVWPMLRRAQYLV